MDPYSLQALLWLTLLQGVGAALQGAVGYGMALISGPILVLIDARMMPGPYLLSSLALTIFMVLRERKALVLGDLIWAIGGRLPGSLLAASLLAVMSLSAVNLTFGILILVGVALSLLGRRFPPTRLNLLVAGVLSGIMGTIAAVGGPPIALVYQNEPGGRLRANMSVFFLFGTTISILTLIPAGKMGWNEVLLALPLLPGILVGFALSSFLVKRLNPTWTRRTVLGVAAASALVVILKQLG